MKLPWEKSDAERIERMLKRAKKNPSHTKALEETAKNSRQATKKTVNKDEKKAAIKTADDAETSTEKPEKIPASHSHIRKYMAETKLENGGFYKCTYGFFLLISLLRNNEKEMAEGVSPTLLKHLNIKKEDIITVLTLIFNLLQNKKMENHEVVRKLKKSKDKFAIDILYHDAMALKGNENESYLPQFKKLTEVMAFMEDLINPDKTKLILTILEAMKIKRSGNEDELNKYLADFTAPTPNEEGEGPDGWGDEKLTSALLADAMEITEKPIDLKMDEVIEKNRELSGKKSTIANPNLPTNQPLNQPTNQPVSQNVLDPPALINEMNTRPELNEAVKKIMGVLNRFKNCTTDDERFDLMDEINATEIAQGNAMGRRFAQFQKDINPENIFELLTDIFKTKSNEELAQKTVEIHSDFKKNFI